jgi:hypothetical protein
VAIFGMARGGRGPTGSTAIFGMAAVPVATCGAVCCWCLCFHARGGSTLPVLLIYGGCIIIITITIIIINILNYVSGATIKHVYYKIYLLSIF